MAPIAAGNLGVLLAGQGDVPGAKAAYQKVIDSGDTDMAPKAAANLRALETGGGRTGREGVGKTLRIVVAAIGDYYQKRSKR